MRLTQLCVEVAFQAPTTQHGVWLAATSNNSVISTFTRLHYVVMTVVGVIMVALSTLQGKGYQVAFNVYSALRSYLATLWIHGYPSQVISDGAAAYYRLDDSSGTVAVDSVARNNATYQGGYTLDQPGGTLDGDAAVSLDGVTGDVTVINSLFNVPSSPFTIEAWIKPAVLPGSNLWMIAGNGGGWSQPGYQMTFYNNKIRFETPGNTLDSVTVLAVGAWYHVVATDDGATKKIYINGALDNSVAYSGWANSQTAAFGIGMGFYPSYQGFHFNGVIDDVSFYRAALTATQVSNHYSLGRTAYFSITAVSMLRTWWHAAKGAFSTYLLDMLAQISNNVADVLLYAYKNAVLADQPQAYYRLDEANGPTAVDSSGNGNNATYSSSGIGFQATGAVENDSAANFTGAGSIDLPAGWANYTQGMSIEFWLNYTGAPNGNTRIFEASTDNTTGQGNAIAVYISQNTATINFFSGATVTWVGAALTGGYHHYVFSQTSTGAVTLYRDGVVVSGSTGSTGVAANINRPYATLAKGPYGLDYLTGTLDEFAVYDHPLTLAQVQNHYNHKTGAPVGGFVYLHNLLVASPITAALSTLLQRGHQQVLAAASAVAGTVAATYIPNSVKVMTAVAGTVAGMSHVVARFYRQLLGVVSASAPVMLAVKAKPVAMAAVSAVVGVLGTVRKYRYAQALAAVGASQAAIVAQKFYHFLMTAMVGSGATFGTFLYHRYSETVAAIAASAPVIAMQYHWTHALTATTTTLGNLATFQYHLYQQALSAVSTVVATVSTQLMRRYQQAMAATTASVTTVGQGITHLFAMTAQTISNVGISVHQFFQYLHAMLAQMGGASAIFAGFGYQLTMLAVSRVNGVVQSLHGKAMTLVAQIAGFAVLVTNRNLVVNQALTALVTFAGVIIRTRAVFMLAQTRGGATLNRIASLSLVMLATAVTQAFRFVQRITQQTYPWTGLPPMTAIGSPGPYFAIDGVDSFKQPDHFRMIPRPLFGVSIRRRPLFSGWPSQEWQWADLSTSEFAALMQRWSAGGPWWTIRWVGTDGGLHTARAHMHEPTVSSRANLRLMGVSVTFTEVQPATVEAAPAWTALAWNPLPPAVIASQHLLRLLTITDNGVLAYDNHATSQWSWSLHHPELPGVYMTAVDPNDPTRQTLLCTRYGPDPSWPRVNPDYRTAGSIWRSADQGVTWTPTATQNLPLASETAGFMISGPGYMAPVFVPGVPGKCFCISSFYSNETYQGAPGITYYLVICQSLDYGHSWSILSQTKYISDNVDPSFHPTSCHWATSPDGKYFIASLNNGGAMSHLVSRDGGATWQQDNAPQSSYGGAYWFVIDPVQSNVWYAASTDQISHLLKSVDAGVTWTDDFPASNLPAHDSSNVGQSFNFFLLAKDPVGKANDIYYLAVSNAAPPGIPGGYSCPNADMVTWLKNGIGQLYESGDAWVDPADQHHFVYTDGLTMYETHNGGASSLPISTSGQPPFSGKPRIFCMEVLDP
jgi:hypothetical protein